MPRVCTRCGNTTLREDSQFCNNCGAPQQLLEEMKPASPPNEVQPRRPSLQKPSLREQIAQQPGARSAQHALPLEVSPPLHQREMRQDVPVARSAPDVLPHQEIFPEQLAFPSAPTHQEVLPEQLAFPSPPSAAARTLHVKVWPQDQDQQEFVSDADKPVTQEEKIEQLPTYALFSAPTEQEAQELALEKLPTNPLLFLSPEVPAQEALEDLPTGPLSSASVEPFLPWHQPSRADADLEKQQEERERIEAVDTALVPVIPASPQPVALPLEVSAAVVLPNAILPAPPVPLAEPEHVVLAPRRKKRGPLVLILAVLLVLILGGVGAWMLLGLPLGVPASTEPYQSLQDSNLGFSLRYPTGWTVQRNAAASMLSMRDSTGTAQMQVLVGKAGGGASSLAQQAAKVGVTNLKSGALPTTISFAHSTWQQVQGSMEQNGATYTGVVLITVYQQRLYTIVQLAPQGIYAQEEQANFAVIRASYQFLG